MLVCVCVHAADSNAATDKHTGAAQEGEANAPRLPLLRREVSRGHPDGFMNINHFQMQYS